MQLHTKNGVTAYCCRDFMAKNFKQKKVVTYKMRPPF